MEAKLRSNAIAHTDFQEYLLKYSNHVPSALAALDDLRYNTVPQTLAQRKSDGESFLEKSELVSLVEWKLKHGKYRPNLAKLVSSNSLAAVREATKEAFQAYDEDSTAYAKAVSRIGNLKGVGPATASLILSCYDPVGIPFFSDELFRYLYWEEAKSGGWDRKIGYTLKEYRELYDRTQNLRERLKKESRKTISALGVEKMAYALAKVVQNSGVVYTTKAERDEQEEDIKAMKPPSPKRPKRTKTAEPPRSPSPKAICLKKGPKGSPTYDKLGYELDYNLIAGRSSGRRRTYKQREEYWERERSESERKLEIMNFSKDKKSAMTNMAQDDRVARDLGIAYHEVGIEEYELWYQKGFRAQPGEFENLSKEEDDRICTLATGSAFRKGSKH